MAKRAHALCVYLVEHYDGNAANVWNDAPTGDDLLDRQRDAGDGALEGIAAGEGGGGLLRPRR